jgi:hypothetical protein
MNVYIETNFILEQSFRQEQHEWCERILELGEEGRVTWSCLLSVLAKPIARRLVEVKDGYDSMTS